MGYYQTESIGRKKSIKVKYYENVIKSNKTTDLIDYLKKNKKYDLFFLIGADNLVYFHRWYKWKKILRKSKLLVFDRQGFKNKSLNSRTYKKHGKKQVTFVKFNKVNISSSKLRKI